MVKLFTVLLDTTERSLKEQKWNTRGGGDAIIYNVRFNFVFFGFCTRLLMEGVAQMKKNKNNHNCRYDKKRLYACL